MFRSRSGVVLLGAIGVIVLFSFLATDSGDVDPLVAPPGSSYGTRDAGLRGYLEVLERSGYTVERARVPFGQTPPTPATTLVVFGGERLDQDDRAAIQSHVTLGGRLIASATDLRFLVGSGATSTVRGPRIATLSFPHPAVASVRSIANPAQVAIDDLGALLSVFGDDSGAVVAYASIGEGEVWVLADPSILSNEALDKEENAGLGLAIAGTPEHAVIFAEFTHGYGPLEGLAALPARWQGALWFAFASGLVWMVLRARRFGPPEQLDHAFPPPRVRYVDALAASLARTKDVEAATAPIRDRLRSELRRRGVDADSPSSESLVRLGSLLDLEPQVIVSALEPPTTTADSVAAGLVMARLTANSFTQKETTWRT